MKHILAVFAVLVAPLALRAQTAVLRGQVTDESGAVIPSATVKLDGPSGLVKTATTAADGSYSFLGLPLGDYTVQASAPDLALPAPLKITLHRGVQTLKLELKIASTVQHVTVQENAGPAVTPEPANNASQLVLHGEDLESLPDDPDDLQEDLQALAGPSAGPNGGSIYIDGFSGGELPPKDSIREIRINQNPFSPEFDKLGYGRIEVFTKPGTDKFHGTGFYNLGDDVWNSRNPYAMQKAPFLLKEYGGNLGGPINSHASFFLDIQRHSIDNGAVINGTTLDPQTLAVINPFTDVFRVPQRRVRIHPRIDYQLGANNTLSVHYGFTRSDIRDNGVGGFELVSRGYHFHDINQTVHVVDTAVLGPNIENEARVGFFRSASQSVANNLDPALLVLGAFNGGGAQMGHSQNTQNNYELQNYTSVLHKTHSFKFGVRLRRESDATVSPANFGGTFTFGGGLAPELDANNQPVLDASGNPILQPIQSIERYRRTLLFESLGMSPAQIRALGGGATQFVINAGIPSLSASQTDAGIFFGDDWRARPNFTLSYGLRYETQTNIHDWRDFAPRVGLAWAPGARGKKSGKTVLRAGFGLFYDRFPLSDTLTAMRYNGILQHQYVVSRPDFFPNIPAISDLGTAQLQAIQKISSTLRAPYLMQSAASIERQLPAHTTVAVTYTNSHGLHMLRSQDINAPLPGTFDPQIPGSGLFPFGSPGPLLLMESSGLYNQNQLITNVNSRLNAAVSLFGFYTYNHAMSNTDGLGTFPANPYSMAGEYGPAEIDMRHRVFLGGSINTKWNLRLSPFFIIHSGAPFDITAGRDIYGDTLFNGRPGIATDPTKPGLIDTPYGLLDPNPTPDEKILPRNFGRGPGEVMFNARLSKTFGFGPAREGGSGGMSGGGGRHRGGPGGPFSTAGFHSMFAPPTTNRRYNLTVSISARNLLNHNNPGPITGNITSPLFGQANQPAGARSFGGTGFLESANNRRLELQMRFTF
ncbi:MAG TPA: carboxypeptidase regulatory-like domain-containing protein [Bryobacteraceae bacterium]|nr:carboxypeptidase regulatory-like domain-containing protein [Bryobacteraceae bacterium]